MDGQLKGNVEFRPYHQIDLNTCRHLIRSNIPDFFTDEEEIAFVDWLENKKKYPYWMVIYKGTLVGCGGVFYNKPEEETGLAWGMIHREYQGMGLGKAFTEFRLDWLETNYPTTNIRITTSDKTEKFYTKLGFVRSGFKENGLSEGLHEVIMDRKYS